MTKRYGVWLALIAMGTLGYATVQVAALREPNTLKMPNQTGPESVAVKHLKFESMLMGSGTSAEGDRVSFERLASPDGVDVFFEFVFPPGGRSVSQVMSDDRRKAKKVLEESKISSPDGYDGTRLVLVQVDDVTGKERIVIAWESKDSVRRIVSTSLGHALEFEKQISQ